MMYMQVLFVPKKGIIITRNEVVELPDIRGTNLTGEQITTCEEKAKSLCREGERVLGWKLLEEFEIKIKEEE